MGLFKKVTDKAQEIMGHPASASASASTSASASDPPLADSSPPVHIDQITLQFRVLGPQRSNLPHIFRDGGGGGSVGGQYLVIYADGSYTRGPPPTDPSRIVSFTSNSLAVAGPGIQRVTDVGSMERGPEQAIAFLTNEGESPTRHGIWPDQNIAPLWQKGSGSRGDAGVTFPVVIDRDQFRQGGQPIQYNTAVEVQMQPDGTAKALRKGKSLFHYPEPLFGSFSTVAAADGFLYLFARVSEETSPRSNGLKLARVSASASGTWADRSSYEFWNGQAFGHEVPAMADSGTANVLSYSLEVFGKHYGPGAGDVFWNDVYGEYVVLFLNAAAALDPTVYLSHSRSLTSGWSAAVPALKLPRAPDGYSYAFHAHPDLDSSGRVVPVTWTRDSKADSCTMQTGEIVFT